jgi:hypothetical protein
MKNNNSFAIFKELVISVIPNYKNKADEVFDSIIWSILKEDKLNRDFQFFSDELNKNGHSIENFSNELFESFAQLVIDKRIDGEPIINYLIDSKNNVFLGHKMFLENLSNSINNLERTNLKQTLKQLEAEIEEKDLEIAITNLERNERKKMLQDIEGFEKEIAVSYNISESDNNISSKRNNDWRFTIKIAAMLILIVLPFGIYIFFFNKGELNNTEQHASNNSKVKLENNSEIKNEDEKSSSLLAKTIDLLDINKINTPESEIQIITKSIKEISDGFGFAKEKLTIQIELVSNLKAESYLSNKRLIINKKQKEIDLLNIKDKDLAKKSLLEADSICKSLIKNIKKLEWSYKFENNKLTLFTNQDIDKKHLEVYSIKDDENAKLNMYYLKIDNFYYAIKINDEDLLIKVVDEVLLDKLEGI